MFEVLHHGAHIQVDIFSCAKLLHILAALHHASFANLGGSQDGQGFGFAYAVEAHEILECEPVEVA